VLLTVALAVTCVFASAGPAAAQRPRAGVPAATDTSPATPAVPRPSAAAPSASGVTLPPNVDAAGQFYDGTALHALYLTMKPDDWETLKANYMLDTYYPADFQWRDVKVPIVGVKSRGFGSRSGTKPSLRIDFNRYDQDQEFLKLNAMILSNAVQDTSMLSRRLSMTIFAAMELPAPRVVHARLFVNGEYVGLYEVIEAIEKTFLGRAFGWDSTGRKRRDGGYLFEYKWDQDYDWSYFGEDFERYARLFEAKTHELEAPSVLYGPIDDMIRTINEVSDSDFEAEVGKYLYLPVFMRHLAVERFVDDRDGFLGDWGPNNIFLYRFEGGTLSAVIPWDKDFTFYDLYDDIFRGFQNSVMGRRILALPNLRRMFLESLVDCADTMAQPAGPGSAVSWLEAEFARQSAQILEAARTDIYKPYGYERVIETHQEYLEYVRNRSAFVRDQALRELERLY
jgi:spore coat protein CotH